MSIAKAEHSSQMLILKAGIQTISSDFLPVQIFICAAGDCPGLLIRCGSRHDGEHLAGEHHMHTICENAFYLLFFLVIIAVKPAIFSVFDPFCLTDMFF